MNAAKGFRQCRVLALVAVLFGAMVRALPRQAYGQQEVDPTGFDPWVASNGLSTRFRHKLPKADMNGKSDLRHCLSAR